MFTLTGQQIVKSPSGDFSPDKKYIYNWFWLCIYCVYRKEFKTDLLRLSMSYLGKVIEVWGRVFRKWEYLGILLISGFIFYLLNGFILNIPNVATAYELFGALGGTIFLFKLSLFFWGSVTFFSAVGTLILSLLIGLLISLLVYRFNVVRSVSLGGGGFLGGVGLFLGAAAPGCAACGVGLVSLLGLGSALYALPFKGNEVVVIAILIVSFSAIHISRKLYKPTCKVKTR